MNSSSRAFNSCHCDWPLQDSSDTGISRGEKSTFAFVSHVPTHGKAISIADTTVRCTEIEIESLRASFHNLQSNIRQTAMAYKNLGLQYYSIPKAIAFDPSIQNPVRKLLRDNFNISEFRELPPMIQTLGLLQYTIHETAVALSMPHVVVNALRAENHLRMAKIWLRETLTLVHWLHHAVTILNTVEEMSRKAGWHRYEGTKAKEERERYRDAWLGALPRVCQGIIGSKIQMGELSEKKQ